MKKILYFLFLSIPLFTLLFCSSFSGEREKATANKMQNETQPNAGNVAVLELFTSQGCSSCPSADRLLETYSHREDIITLSFHVDYWNRLGWKDPYSSSEYSQRQYKYASALKSSVYTPQLIINGENEMVGSNVKKIESALKKALSRDVKSTLSIDNVDMKNGQAVVIYSVAGNSPDDILNIALIEKKTETKIKAGENNGVTLSGTNVVRNFKTINNLHGGTNTSSIEIPAEIDVKNLAMVLYLQESHDNKIVAADRVDVM